jgi:hypothetical protein
MHDDQPGGALSGEQDGAIQRAVAAGAEVSGDYDAAVCHVNSLLPCCYWMYFMARLRRVADAVGFPGVDDGTGDDILSPDLRRRCRKFLVSSSDGMATEVKYRDLRRFAIDVRQTRHLMHYAARTDRIDVNRNLFGASS